MSNKKPVIISIVLLLLIGGYQLYDNILKYEFYTDHNYEETYDYTDEFMKHVDGFDKVMWNGDPLMPDLAYFKDEKMIGVTTRRGPEWGSRNTRYFFDGEGNERLVKVINHDDGDENRHMTPGGEVIPDLLLVVDVINDKTFAYGRTLNGEEVENQESLTQISVDFSDYSPPSSQIWQEIGSCHDLDIVDGCYSLDSYRE